MLVPEDAPIDADTSTQSKSQAAERYSSAMKYLTSKAPNSAKTVVDVYVEKQQAWTDSMKEWDAAKQAAHGRYQHVSFYNHKTDGKQPRPGRNIPRT